MKTITAVELRKNMGEIFARVNNGEEITVTYRNNTSVNIVSDKPKTTKKKTNDDIAAFLDALDEASKQVTHDPIGDRDMMEVYYEDMAKKHGLS